MRPKPSLLTPSDKLAITVNLIDKRIYELIRLEVSHRVVLSGISIQDFLKAYHEYGQHNIDFSKIYDIEVEK